MPDFLGCTVIRHTPGHEEDFSVHGASCQVLGFTSCILLSEAAALSRTASSVLCLFASAMASFSCESSIRPVVRELAAEWKAPKLFLTLGALRTRSGPQSVALVAL